MKCPTCAGFLSKHYGDEVFIWLCPVCGTATWGEGCAVYVPIHARNHAALREIVKEVVAGTHFIDPRMKYGEYQVGRSELEEMKATLALEPEARRGE